MAESPPCPLPAHPVHAEIFLATTSSGLPSPGQLGATGSHKICSTPLARCVRTGSHAEPRGEAPAPRLSRDPFSSIPGAGMAPLWPTERREEMQNTESALSACEVAHIKITWHSWGCASSVSSGCLAALCFCGLTPLVGFVALR